MRKVICTICLMLIIGLTGCSWFADKRVIVKPKIDTTSPKFRKLLSDVIKGRYKTESALRDIEAELVYQKYLLWLKEKNKDSKKERRGQMGAKIKCVRCKYRGELIAKNVTDLSKLALSQLPRQARIY